MTQRETKAAILRGMRGKCPNCGEGHLFTGFLQQVDRCAHCGEDFTKIRAADGPAFFVLCVTCLLLIPASLIVSNLVPDSPLTVAGILISGFVIISLALLRPMKGAVIGLQWSGHDYER